MKKRVCNLKAGQGFEYKGDYYIKDNINCSVRLTNEKTGRNIGKVYYSFRAQKVRPVTLLVEEER